MKKIIAMLFVTTICSQGVFALPNPASENCVDQGFKLVMLEGKGGTSGICIFHDNTYCEEWSFFYKNCEIGQNVFPNGTFDENNLNQYCLTKGENPQVVLCNQQ